MKTHTLVTTLFAIASFPLLAQQPTPAYQRDSPATQQSPQAADTVQPNSAASPETPTMPMSAINGELIGGLDSKTAKRGDSIVVQTKTSAKTADGTEIPKGSKLVGHVIVVQPSEAGNNSQMALQFDHLELKGGQSMPVHSEIQSITPAGGAAATSESSAMTAPPTSASPNSTPGGSAGDSRASGAPQGAGASSGATPTATSVPPPGTVVARNGKIAIHTTSFPGVLLANNAPGQQDPRMAHTSSILLGAKQDIRLGGGTQLVLGVSAASSPTSPTQ